MRITTRPIKAIGGEEVEDDPDKTQPIKIP